MSPAEAQRLLDENALATGVGYVRLVDEADVPLEDDPGQFLLRARQALGLSVPQVAGLLKLKTAVVEDVEAMRFERLHGLGYALGFVRAYAELITARSPNPALVERIVDAFRARWEPVQKRKEAGLKPFQAGTMVPVGVLLVLGVVAWLAISAVAQSLQPREPEVVGPPDEAIRAWTEAAPVAPSRAVATVDPLVSIHALRDVRVTLRGEDGALVVDRYLRAGEVIPADGLGRFFLSTPDGGAVEVRGHGQVVAVGTAGEKADWWRVPDLVALEQAQLEAQRAAVAAAAADTAAATPAPAAPATSP
jgi:hypothetical protein